MTTATTTLTTLTAAVARVLTWATEQELPEPQQVQIYRTPLASGHSVCLVLADIDDLYLYAQAMGEVIEHRPDMAWTIGDLFDLPVFCRIEVAV